MTLPIVILAGGLATRLKPLTERIPKSLVDVAGQPFAVHQIELLQRRGVRDITFLVGHLGSMIEDALGDGTRWGVRIRYIFDGGQRLGTGGAVLHALPAVADPFFVLYGDSYLDCDYVAIADAFGRCGCRGLMTVCRNEDRWDRSNVLWDSGRIVRYDKHDRTSDMRHIDYGLGVFRHAAFAGFEAGRQLDLATVYQRLLAEDDLTGYEVPGRFYEIGSPQGLAETREYLALGSGAPQ